MATDSRRSRNSYARSRRSVTLTPTGIPSRSLNAAIDLRARRTDGRCPAIVASCSVAASSIRVSCLASPTPMFSVIFSIRGTCIVDEYPNRSLSCGRISSAYLSLRRAMSVEPGVRALGDAVGLAVLAGHADARRLLVLGVEQHHVGDVDAALLLHAPADRLGALRAGNLLRAHVALDDVQALDVDPI